MEPPTPAAAAATKCLEVPSWLAERFPKWAWESLHVCKLRVAEDGAGLHMEEGDNGYLVETVESAPGQDAALRPGCIIICINGKRLMGLPDADALQSVFGSEFQDNAEVVLLNAEELRRAEIERDANEECPCEFPEDDDGEEKGAPVQESGNYELLWRVKSETEHEASVRIPVGRATMWCLAPEVLHNLQRDLEELGRRFELHAQAHFNQAGGMDSVALSGLPSAIANARPEVIKVLQWYRQGQSQAADASGAATLDEAPTSPVAVAAVEQSILPSLKVPAHVLDLGQFQYHDHTADIIVHSWGRTRSEAFAQVVVGMFQYMTDLERVDMTRALEVEATGHDLLDLLYHLLDEFLYTFGTEMHISRCVEILEFDDAAFRIRARGYGERMNLKKHNQGTEIKAITMHMMKIIGPESVITETGVTPRAEVQDALHKGFPHEAYVLLDI